MAENIKDKLNKLVFDFKLSNYRDLNESQTRISYIDRFWELLGWNVRNPLEVQVERTEKSYMGRRPDYRFIKGNKTLFFVEAKKPAEDLTNPRHIYQTKLYCWNGKVPIAILTDFEEFRPFRALGKPLITDAKKGLIKELDMVCDEYPDRVDDLLATFGREAVFAGSLDDLVKPTQLELRDTVDKHFLNSLSEWRIKLASLIAKKNHFDNEFELAEATQRILDRLVFLRILQDRDIENTDFIKSILEHRVGNSYAAFLLICKELAPKYNGLIFNPHPLSENLTIEASLFKNIVKELNVEDSPYRFDEIPVEVLGTIYERFLGDEISFDKGRQVVIDQKPEVRKAGGVYYTPQYIVEYIVANTVGKLLEQARTPDDVSRLKILDPACGSGSFLLGAFDALIKWHENYYSAHPTEIYEKKGRNTHLLAYLDETETLRLTARKKGRILQNNIYGVDIDKQATEVAQMSLYLKVLEGIAKEPLAVLGFQDALLPKMDDNIKCGNSLIGSDFISDDFFGMSERERHKINPFDWEVAFPFLKVTGGFDAVIGNPPWGSKEVLDSKLLPYLNKRFNRKIHNLNIFALFIDLSLKILIKNRGILGFLIPKNFSKTSAYIEYRTDILTKFVLSQIVDFGKFPEVAQESIGIFVNKEHNPDYKINRYILSTSGNLQQIEALFLKNIIKDNFKVITLSHLQGFSSVMEKIEAGTFMLNDSFNVMRGLEHGRNGDLIKCPYCNKYFERPGKGNKTLTEINCKHCKSVVQIDSEKFNYKFISKSKISEKHIPLLIGNSISRYQLKEIPYYIELGIDGIDYKEITNIKEKLLFIRISKDLRGYFDNNNLLCLNAINIVYKSSDSKYDLKYILGILNSKLYKSFIDYQFTSGASLTIRLSNEIMRSLPIKSIEFDSQNEKAQHDKLVELVERMLRLHKELQAATEFDRKHIEQYISRTDKEIDALVYQLYALTPEEIRIVEGGE